MPKNPVIYYIFPQPVFERTSLRREQHSNSFTSASLVLSGLIRYFGSEMNDVTQKQADIGFQLHFHLVGERGAGIAIEAIESLNTHKICHRLMHCYLVDEHDRP